MSEVIEVEDKESTPMGVTGQVEVGAGGPAPESAPGKLRSPAKAILYVVSNWVFLLGFAAWAGLLLAPWLIHTATLLAGFVLLGMGVLWAFAARNASIITVYVARRLLEAREMQPGTP